MGNEKLFVYFMNGIAMVVALYEICRTEKRSRYRKLK